MTFATRPVHTASPSRPASAGLIHRVSELQGALHAAARDRTQLEGQLARTRAENRGIRDELARRPGNHRNDRSARVREMLSEPWSRNP
jgi:hypothetical protein